ncbi:MAG: alpha-glucan phosphorylase [Ignavibacteriae bacterium HGW-Ignavibacteriae-2]|jgi:starch phosphorylase|nr:alpha-glucan family phosphorylase [Bacteroidota bacterium]PKL88572.1 MAG: alpha-glucan phosphorylase [Ignavibacteriae bacterium HGW-Ignavibacteriae-2]
MINFIGNFNVVASLPKKLEPMRKIVSNLYWSWNIDALSLFRRMDRDLWQQTNHNPILMLGMLGQERLEELSNDDGFLSHLNRVKLQFDNYLTDARWYQKEYNKDKDKYIAYFSAEFGLTECLQIYSGGLGILSGDHMKSASDLGLPLVGVGLCYKEGYFQQYLNNDGYQQEKYDLIDFYNQPMELVLNDKGEPIKIDMNFPGRIVKVQVWKIEVGRVPLYLLDTNIPENNADDQKITRSLYGGNIETRIQQEIILGIGGIRVLHALGIKPEVCHMNEGHSAFLSLERILFLIKNHNLSFDEAKEVGFYSNIFTTHTPVPAGIDVFPNELVEKYFSNYYRTELGISDKTFYKLGTIIKNREPNNFNMAHLAMNMAGFVNGVSKLHGVVSKTMWANGFKDIPFDEIPIDYITNGVHTQSHLSNDMFELLVRYLGDDIQQNPSDKELWEAVEDIPDEELWRTHERRRERLVAFARKRLRAQLLSRGASSYDIESSKEVLDASALTIGFARRFATYKRATLIFKDLERLASIMLNSKRPVQLIIAGKAHPKDEEGKKLIQDIVSFTKDESLRKRIVFIENYDMNIARYMVEGCDVWLNNPRRPLEASGTSGMKIIANGGLNFSVLDGWWDEAYNYELGWKIGHGEEYENLDYQDEVESSMLYETLENEIVPQFYERGDDKLPRKWLKMMKNSMKTLAPIFNTHRMVRQYATKFYLPAHNNRRMLMANNWLEAKNFMTWKNNIVSNWNAIKFIKVESEHQNGEVKIGSSYKISADIDMPNLTPEDVEVQIYYGKVDDQNIAFANSFMEMTCLTKKSTSGKYKYEGVIDCSKTGQFGYTLRILPKHPLLTNKFELGLIKWA